MLAYLAAFVVAAALSALLTPLMRIVAFRIGAVSSTGGRNINTTVMPRLGGVSIAVATIAPLAMLFFVRSEVANVVRGQSGLVLGLAAGAVTMCIVGAWDDIRPVRALHKLAVQVLCALAAYYAGFRIQAISLPFFDSLDMGVFALIVTVIWIVGVTNAVNLIDGLDGLAAGIVFCAAGTNLIVAAIGGSVLVAVTMAATMGSLFGFLFYNFNPAKIYMGDSGSYFLGFVLATISLSGNQKASTAVSLLVPILALGVPIFDTLFSIVRRTLERRPLFAADRGHLHHRLLDMGLTHKRAVLTLYSLSLAFAISAVAMSLGRDWQTGAAILLAAALVAGLVRFVGGFQSMQAQARGPKETPRQLRALSAALPKLLVDLTRNPTLGRLSELLSEATGSLDFESWEFDPVGETEVSSAKPITSRTDRFAFHSSTGKGVLFVELERNQSLPEDLRPLLQLLADIGGELANRDSSQSIDLAADKRDQMELAAAQPKPR